MEALLKVSPRAWSAVARILMELLYCRIGLLEETAKLQKKRLGSQMAIIDMLKQRLLMHGDDYDGQPDHIN